MIDNRLHYEGEGYTEDGRRMPNITIDTCKYMNRFETMVLRNSIDLACKYADTIEEAEKQYNELVEQYTVKNKPRVNMELLDFLVRNASKKKWSVVNIYPSDMPNGFPFNFRGSVDEIPDDIAFGDIYELRSDHYLYAKMDNDTLYRILPEPILRL